VRTRITKARLRHAYYLAASEAARLAANKRTLQRLAASPDPTLRALGLALDDILEHRVSAEEQVWIDRIEDARARLEASPEVVSLARVQPDGAPTGLRAKAMLEGTAADLTEADAKTAVVGQICRTTSKSAVWGFVLFKLIRHLKPKNCLEIGTCLGMSAAYQSAALQMDDGGRMVTVEGIESLAGLAAANLDGLGLASASVVAGMFEDIWESTADGITPIDYAFIDGSHNPRATLLYFDEIEARMHEGGVMVFDDIHWSKGMSATWTILQMHPHVTATIDLFDIGLAVIGPPRQTEKYSVGLGLSALKR
jgi:predicted O-methyltransferase YrrM